MKRLGATIFASILLLAASGTLSITAQQGTPHRPIALAASPTPVNISNSATNSDTPLLGVDGNGAAYLVWYEYLSNRSFYFATNKSGQWSSPQYVDQIVYDMEEAGYPWMDVSASGICHMIFQDGRDYVSYDIYDAVYQNNSWSSLENVSNNNGGSCYGGVAINPVDNYAYVVWQDGTGLESGWNILFRFRSPAGSWGATQILPLGGGYMPKIDIDAAGTAHVIWTTGWGRTLWYSKNQTPQNVNSWTAPTLIKGDVGEDWSYAKVACDNAGNAYVIWMDGTVGNDEIFLRKVNSNGTLGAEINVSQSAASSQEGAVAVDKNNGNIIVAWKENTDIFANAFLGGSWSGPGSITNGLAPSKTPSVAVDSLGGAHLAYSSYINGNWEILYMVLTSAIYVTSPNGGEAWDPGTSHNITWQSMGVAGNVKIEYSTNDGSSYTTITNSTANTGSFSWTVPNTPSASCRVRVSEAATGIPSDVSDAVFTIVGQVVCTYSVFPESQSFSSLGGAGSINVTSQGGCNWTAVSNDVWISITAGSTGSGNGAVQFSVAENFSSSSRSGTATVAGHVCTISQAGTGAVDNAFSNYQVIPECIWASAYGGGTWISEVQITDLTGGSVVHATFNYGGGNRRGKFALWTGPGILSSIKFSNILSTLFGLDPSFSYFGRLGAIEFSTQDVGHTIQVVARTFNGNYTKTFPGLSPVDSNTADMTRAMVIPNVVNNATYRTTCGIFNPTPTSMTAAFTLSDASNIQIGATFSKTFVGYDFQAFNPFAAAGVPYQTTSYDNVVLRVAPITGRGKLMMFGASANNVTNDPVAHIPVQSQTGFSNSPSQYQILPEAIWAPASGGGTWVSEVQIRDATGGSNVSVTFNYGGGLRRGPFTLWTGPGAGYKVKYANILSAISALDTSFAYYGRVGALEFTTQDVSHVIQVATRTLNGNASKTFPGLNWVDTNTADTSRKMLIQNLVSTSLYRSTCGFFNATASPVTVQFGLLNGSGALVGAPFSKTLAGYDFVVFNPFKEAGVPYPGNSLDNMILIVNPISGAGKVMCFGASVNNLTNDPAAHIAGLLQ